LLDFFLFEIPVESAENRKDSFVQRKLLNSHYASMIRARSRRTKQGDRESCSASTLLKRDFQLIKDTPELQKDLISAAPDFLVWKITFCTEKESVYAGRQYTAIVNFRRHFPIESPVVKLCDTDATRFNPLPVETAQDGSLQIESLMSDLWRPMTAVQVLLCVKTLFAKKPPKVALSSSSSISLVSLFAAVSSGNVALLHLAEYLGVSALSSLSATCVDFLTATHSDRIWSQMYFSNVTIPPIALYAIANFDLVRVRLPCGGWRWTGARDALRRASQVGAYLSSNNICHVAIQEVQVLFIVRKVASQQYLGKYCSPRLSAALTSLDEATMLCVTNRYRRAVRVALACFSESEFLEHLLKPISVMFQSLSMFLVNQCGLSANMILGIGNLCSRSLQYTHDVFAARRQEFELSPVYRPRFGDYLCALCDEHNATCRVFAADIQLNIFDCRDKSSSWRIACTEEGRWAEAAWHDWLPLDPQYFIDRSRRDQQEEEGDHRTRLYDGENTFQRNVRLGGWQQLQQYMQHLTPRQLHTQLQRRCLMQQRAYQGIGPHNLCRLNQDDDVDEGADQDVNQPDLLPGLPNLPGAPAQQAVEPELGAWHEILQLHHEQVQFLPQIAHLQHYVEAFCLVDVVPITAEYRASVLALQSEHIVLGDNLQTELPDALSVHYLGCHEKFNERRTRITNRFAPPSVAPFRSRVGLAPTVARAGVRDMLRARVGAVRHPPPASSCYVTLRALLLSHVPGCGVARYLVGADTTTVGELLKDFKHIYRDSALAQGLDRVGILRDMAKSINKAFQFEAFGERKEDFCAAVRPGADEVSYLSLGDLLSVHVAVYSKTEVIFDVL
jgi:ubiquitin-protein ligase